MCRTFKEHVILKLSLAMNFDAETFSRQKREVITRYSLKNMDTLYWYELDDGILLAAAPEWAGLCDAYIEEENPPYTPQGLMHYLPQGLWEDENERIYFGYLNPETWAKNKNNQRGRVENFSSLNEKEQQKVQQFLEAHQGEEFLVDTEHDICLVVYEKDEIMGVSSMIYHARHILDASLCIKEGEEEKGYIEALIDNLSKRAEQEHYLFEILINEREQKLRQVLAYMGFEYLLKRKKYMGA